MCLASYFGAISDGDSTSANSTASPTSSVKIFATTAAMAFTRAEPPACSTHDFSCSFPREPGLTDHAWLLFALGGGSGAGVTWSSALVGVVSSRLCGVARSV